MRILIADVAAEDARLRSILHGDDLMFARTTRDVEKALGDSRFDLGVVCLQFDESRMFELLGLVQREPRFNLPVACIRGDSVPSHAPPLARYRSTVEALGASALIDFQAITRDGAGDDSIRRVLYRCIEKGTMMKKSNTYSRILEKACETAGSRERLADILGVERDDLSRWISAGDLPPYSVFLAALDIVARGPYALPQARAELRAFEQLPKG